MSSGNFIFSLLGVLTKIDLMNENSDVMNYLNNEYQIIKKNLIGYFQLRIKP